MKKIIVPAFALAVLAGGCSMSPTPVELDYGTSTKLATYGQILDPEASGNLEPVTGMSGLVAEGIMQGYLSRVGGVQPEENRKTETGKTGAFDFTYSVSAKESPSAEGAGE
jgi:hypothetical protein